MPKQGKRKRGGGRGVALEGATPGASDLTPSDVRQFDAHAAGEPRGCLVGRPAATTPFSNLFKYF
jgi:hypothetical protein